MNLQLPFHPPAPTVSSALGAVRALHGTQDCRAAHRNYLRGRANKTADMQTCRPARVWIPKDFLNFSIPTYHPLAPPSTLPDYRWIATMILVLPAIPSYELLY